MLSGGNIAQESSIKTSGSVPRYIKESEDSISELRVLRKSKHTQKRHLKRLKAELMLLCFQIDLQINQVGNDQSREMPPASKGLKNNPSDQNESVGKSINY